MPMPASDQLNHALAALAAADIQTPNIPMAVFNQQGRDIGVFLEQNPPVKRRLLEVGVSEERLAELPLVIRVTSQTESAWQAVSSPRRPEDLRQLEQQGAGLRSDVVAALRWNLRHDRIAQGTLNAIQEGDGTADLAQDLGALAMLIEQHPRAFDADQTFDPEERAAACRRMANELAASVSHVRADLTRAQAKEQRDRAFTYADDLLDEIREAARYAFRKEPELLVHFQDRYRAEARRRSRKRADTKQPVSEDA